MDLVSFRYEKEGGWTVALPRALDGPRTLVLAFGAARAESVLPALAELRSALPGSVLMGCSTAGEIAGGQVLDDGISVAIARFEHTQLRQAWATVEQAGDSQAAGAELAHQLAGPDLRAVLVLSDGLGVNGTALVGALAAELPPEVVITGGLAGDGARFERTWILKQGQPTAGQVGAVGLYGRRLNVGHGCRGGWSDFGPERRITRSDGNVLYELDGQPALDLYKNYLGERAAGLPGTALLFPLSIKRNQPGAEAIVRTILAIDEEARSLTFAGDVPQGSVARLMRANTDQLIDSAGLAGRHAGQGLAPDAQALVVSVSCVGRRLVLGERTDEEVETVLDGMPSGSAQVGFYSYGEIAPSQGGLASDLHNQTMTVTVLSEA